jgi:hypothetical protein
MEPRVAYRLLRRGRPLRPHLNRPTVLTAVQATVSAPARLQDDVDTPAPTQDVIAELVSAPMIEV